MTGLYTYNSYIYPTPPGWANSKKSWAVSEATEVLSKRLEEQPISTGEQVEGEYPTEFPIDGYILVNLITTSLFSRSLEACLIRVPFYGLNSGVYMYIFIYTHDYPCIYIYIYTYVRNKPRMVATNDIPPMENCYVVTCRKTHRLG